MFLAMSTVTSHTLLSRSAAPMPVKFPAGEPHCSWKPCAPAGKIRPPALCNCVDPKSAEHPFNISPVALVHPKMPPTSAPRWEITEDDKHVTLSFYIPEQATEDLEVKIADDVLVIGTKPKPPPADAGQQGRVIDGGSFHVRLLMPAGYNKEDVRAELKLRALVVTVGKVQPAFNKEIPITRK